MLPAPAGFLSELRKLCTENGSLLLFDEVQTGVGRTGTFLACQGEGVEPDVVALAKALGGGVPIGAMLCRAHLSEALPPGSHGSTFGGNPLASAAALAVLDALEHDGLLAQVSETGAFLGGELQALAKKHEKVVATSRGRGLLQALVLRDQVDARAVMTTLQERGRAGHHRGRTSAPFLSAARGHARGAPRGARQGGRGARGYQRMSSLR